MADTYINDSDYAFTNQLDDYKLGTSFHGGNDYEEGQAAFNNMPEAMAVGRLMAMRQQAHMTSMDSRKTMFDEERAVKEEQEFGQFAERAQGLSPDDIEGNAKFYAKEARSNPRNKQIMGAIETMGKADMVPSNARKNAFEIRQQDDLIKDYDENYKSRAESSHLMQQKYLNEAKRGNRESELSLYEAEKFDDKRYMGMAGSFTERHPEVAKAFTSFIEDATDKGLDPRYVDEVYRMGNLFSKATSLEGIDGAKHKKNEVILSRVNNAKGTNVTELEDAEQLDLIKNLMKKDKDGRLVPDHLGRKTALSALDAHKQFMKSSSERELVGKVLTGLLTEAPTKGDQEGLVTWRKKIRSASLGLGVMGGKIDSELDQREKDFKTDSRIREVQKDMLDFQKKQKDMSDDTKKLELARQALALREAHQDDRQAMEFMKEHLDQFDDVDIEDSEGIKGIFDNYRESIRKSNKAVPIKL